MKKKFLDNFYVRRVFAFYIDLLIVTVLALIYLFMFDRKGPTIECDFFLCWNTKRVLTFQLIFYFIYFLLMEFYFHSTIGKKIFGFKVLVEKNEKVFWRILLRTLIRLIPFDFFSYLLDKNSLFWHEKWINIFTIKKNIDNDPVFYD
ncbi:RDD family protein [Flavobacteriaceae bacterium]|nr:RDD family protein [Flavobacteriaceae bacterium]